MLAPLTPMFESFQSLKALSVLIKRLMTPQIPIFQCLSSLHSLSKFFCVLILLLVKVLANLQHSTLFRFAITIYNKTYSRLCFGERFVHKVKKKSIILRQISCDIWLRKNSNRPNILHLFQMRFINIYTFDAQQLLRQLSFCVCVF